ncbi:hypothetical protein MUK42_34260 [Musa troglodytarum]|uniref:Uncharacterized protein n=1 Tax=Musa troglodytarum TaxID=320322 RepID=A0A9E7KBS2_9LILI|nr:hypothetical protein MUK42_34260 [Musa troglodytarum]
MTDPKSASSRYSPSAGGIDLLYCRGHIRLLLPDGYVFPPTERSISVTLCFSTIYGEPQKLSTNNLAMFHP